MRKPQPSVGKAGVCEHSRQLKLLCSEIQLLLRFRGKRRQAATTLAWMFVLVDAQPSERMELTTWPGSSPGVSPTRSS